MLCIIIYHILKCICEIYFEKSFSISKTQPGLRCVGCNKRIIVLMQKYDSYKNGYMVSFNFDNYKSSLSYYQTYICQNMYFNYKINTILRRIIGLLQLFLIICITTAVSKTITWNVTPRVLHNTQIIQISILPPLESFALANASNDLENSAFVQPNNITYLSTA